MSEVHEMLCRYMPCVLLAVMFMLPRACPPDFRQETGRSAPQAPVGDGYGRLVKLEGHCLGVVCRVLACTERTDRLTDRKCCCCAHNTKLCHTMQSNAYAPDVECKMVSTAWLSGGPDRGTNSRPMMLPDKRSIQEPARSIGVSIPDICQAEGGAECADEVGLIDLHRRVSVHSKGVVAATLHKLKDVTRRSV